MSISGAPTPDVSPVGVRHPKRPLQWHTPHSGAHMSHLNSNRLVTRESCARGRPAGAGGQRRLGRGGGTRSCPDDVVQP
eukprot:6323013-Prymnesium_polylepis.1